MSFVVDGETAASPPGHIVSMSLTELSLGRLLASRADLRFTRQPSHYTTGSLALNRQVTHIGS